MVGDIYTKEFWVSDIPAINQGGLLLDCIEFHVSLLSMYNGLGKYVDCLA